MLFLPSLKERRSALKKEDNIPDIYGLRNAREEDLYLYKVLSDLKEKGNIDSYDKSFLVMNKIDGRFITVEQRKNDCKLAFTKTFDAYIKIKEKMLLVSHKCLVGLGRSSNKCCYRTF